MKTEGFVIMTETISGLDLVWSTTNDNEETIPIIFDSKEEAWKEVAETMIITLQQFIDGEREFEDTDFACFDVVCSFKYQNDIISVFTEDNELIYSDTLKNWRKNL